MFFSLVSRPILGTKCLTGPYATSDLSGYGAALRNSQNEDDCKVADFANFSVLPSASGGICGNTGFRSDAMSAIMSAQPA